jgi:hypothetical protein
VRALEYEQSSAHRSGSNASDASVGAERPVGGNKKIERSCGHRGYKAQTAHDDIVGWSVVLASDWGESSYPKWATVCTSQHVRYNGKYVVVDFCAQAIGAGGRCAGGGGTYRSRTGDAQGWQIQADKDWITLPRY